MILIDTGPLVAAFDSSDQWHQWCSQVLGRARRTFATTTPVLTEAFHFLRTDSRVGRNLIDFVSRGGLLVLSLDYEDLHRALELMVKYQDAPMDFADASLAAIAESHRLRSIFTIDTRHLTT